MASKLTDAKLQGLKAPERGQVEHSDSDVPGLRVRIGVTGAKSFIIRKRVDGKVRNIALGRYGPRFGIAEARRKARALLSDIEAGKGVPTAAVRSEGPATVAALIPDYLASKAHLRSIGEVKRILEGYVKPELGDRLADAVTRRDVTRLIDAIGARSPTMARAVHAQLSAFYSWALPRLDRMESNPCRDAGRPAKPKARDRVLSDDELAALWRVSLAEPLPWGPALRLLILTGARRDEVFAADRAEFDLKAREWVIPGARTKNGEPHIIPLSASACAVVKDIPAIEGSGKLFPSQRAATAAERGSSGFSKAATRWRLKVDQALGREEGPHWQMHDIRRTVATGMQRLGVRFEVTEAVLNHVSGSRGGVAGVYQRHDWKSEKRAALDAWQAAVKAVCASKITQQRR